jgi:hypothetical protein
METHAFGFTLRANAPEGAKAISYQSISNPDEFSRQRGFIAAN